MRLIDERFGWTPQRPNFATSRRQWKERHSWDARDPSVTPSVAEGYIPTTVEGKTFVGRA
jgi:hypothetical protein